MGSSRKRSTWAVDHGKPSRVPSSFGIHWAFSLAFWSHTLQPSSRKVAAVCAPPFSGDLAQVKAKVLVLPRATERLLSLESACAIAKYVADARYYETPSRRGHLAWRANTGAPETAFVIQKVRAFLST